MIEGQLLGRYELLEQLGEGGMGSVWLARLTGAAGFEKLCIVKTVLPSIAKDADFVSRFLHEGRVLTQLSHGNIAQVLDMNEVDGQLFLALEYVAGVDLWRLHEQVRAVQEFMPLPLVVALITQAAEGLGAAHRKAALDGSALNIVHRDVSPHNIMVSYEGEVKVIDFGIAKSEARSRHTAQASVMGKLGYMAPEQARGDPVDHRADQYALSIVAWELLSNQSWVRRGTLTEMVVAMAHPTVRALAPLRTDVPASLEAVVLKALSPLPDARFATTDEFAQVLMGELLKLGAPPTKPQLGQYVRSRCASDFATTRQLLTRVSTQRSPPPLEQRPKADMFAETVVRPGVTPGVTVPSRPSLAETLAAPSSLSPERADAPDLTIAGGAGGATAGPLSPAALSAALDETAQPTPSSRSGAGAAELTIAAPLTTIAGGPGPEGREVPGAGAGVATNAAASRAELSAALDVTAQPTPHAAPTTTIAGGPGADRAPITTVAGGSGGATAPPTSRAELSAALDVTAQPTPAGAALLTPIEGSAPITTVAGGSGAATVPPMSRAELSAALDVTASPPHAPVATLGGGPAVERAPITTVPGGSGVATALPTSRAEVLAALDVTASPTHLEVARPVIATVPGGSGASVVKPQAATLDVPAPTLGPSPPGGSSVPVSVDPLPSLTPVDRPSVRVDVQAVPPRGQLPLSTGEMAAVNPSRAPTALVIGLIGLLLVGAALSLVFRNPDEVATVAVIDAGVPVLVVADPVIADAGAVPEELDAGNAIAALGGPDPVDVPPEPRPNLTVAGRLVGKTWFVTNQQRNNWTRCRMTLPKQRVIAIGTMPHGGKLDLPLGRFAFDKRAPLLEGRARIDCEQGFGLIELP